MLEKEKIEKNKAEEETLRCRNMLKILEDKLKTQTKTQYSSEKNASTSFLSSYSPTSSNNSRLQQFSSYSSKIIKEMEKKISLFEPENERKKEKKREREIVEFNLSEKRKEDHQRKKWDEEKSKVKESVSDSEKEQELKKSNLKIYNKKGSSSSSYSSSPVSKNKLNSSYSPISSSASASPKPKNKGFSSRKGDNASDYGIVCFVFVFLCTYRMKLIKKIVKRIVITIMVF
jgi:hypothetical protein